MIPVSARQGLITRRDQATAQVLARLDPVRRRAFLRLLRWTQAAGPVREDALADVGLAWPLLRRLVLELGRRLVEAGTLTAAEDVFWLTRAEIEAEFARPTGSRSEQIEQRKAAWRGQRRATPPQVLPKGRWTMLFDSMLPAASETQTGRVIRGIGGSAGKVTGPARVLSGPADFDQMRPGDILVAQITTPAWTTLFAMAGGVVTDVGGPLSHSSIVAREYGIPAVLGTGVATRRITSGEQITVDGDAGTVTLSEGAGRPGSRSRPGRGAGWAYLAAAVAAVLARPRPSTPAQRDRRQNLRSETPPRPTGLGTGRAKRWNGAMSTVRVSPRAEEARADVVVGIGPISFDDVVAVARHGARVRISEHALSEVRRTRAVIEALAADDQPHYGISTGFGALATRHIPVEQRAQLQRSLVRSHAAGSGPEVEREVVRALMLLRISTLATGRTGIRAETLAAYVAMLNAGITPSCTSTAASAAPATWPRWPTARWP